MDMGVDCFKTDFGERIPTDVVVVRRRRPGADAQLLQRTCTTRPSSSCSAPIEVSRRRCVRPIGDRRRSAVPGALGRRLRVDVRVDGGACAAACPWQSGFGFWSHDIGGFEGRPDPEVFKRWIPFGLLCTHSRLHGSDSYRVPWLFDDEAVEVLRTFTRLKAQLMPYIYGQAVAAARDGMPVLRPMVSEFADDPACAHLDRQYMFGGSPAGRPVFRRPGNLVLHPGRHMDAPADRCDRARPGLGQRGV